MNYTTLSSWGPEKTPTFIKYLLIITSIIAILSAGIQEAFDQFNVFPGPQNLLSLSWWGMTTGYIWQPLSFIFIQNSSPDGLSFFFFITLFFNLYLLWITGSALYQIFGLNSFLKLYFIGGIAAGILALFSMKITGQYEVLTGLTSTLLIIFTVWSMAFPETEILLFLLIPVKVKWIAASVMGILLLSNLSHLDFANFFLYFFAIVIGYIYSVIIHGWYSPFPITLKFDLWLARIGSFFRQKFSWFRNKNTSQKVTKTKIIDLTGQSINDDEAFVDAMLNKISKRGEDSLSWSEKKRLQGISQKKMDQDSKN